MIARKSALIVITQILNGILGFIALKFISKFMQPWEYGVVGFAYGFVAIFSIFGKLGFDQAHIKRVSEGKDMGNCIATFAVIKIFLVALLSLTVILSIAVWKFVMHRGFESPVNEKAIYIMLSYFALSTLSSIMISTFNARKEIAKARLPYSAFVLMRVVATVFIAYMDLGPLALAYAYLFGEIFRFALAMVFFKGYPVGKPSIEYAKSYIAFARPMAIASASWIVMTNIDKVFIQLFWSATQVGEYFAVFNLSRFVILFASSLGILLLPTFSEHHARNDANAIKNIVLQSERYLSMIVFPIVIAMIFLAKPIIHMLLSDKYMPALPVLQILPLFVLLDALSRPYQSQLQGMNMPQYSRNSIFMMMLTNVFLNFILIPKDIRSLGLKLFGLGIKGAAISTVISYFIGLVYIRISSWRVTGIAGGKSLFYHFIAAAAMAMALHEMQNIMKIRLWYHLIFASSLGFAVYLAVLVMLKEFKKQDFDLFMDTLNIKKMLKYVWGEIKH